MSHFYVVLTDVLKNKNKVNEKCINIFKNRIKLKRTQLTKLQITKTLT